MPACGGGGQEKFVVSLLLLPFVRVHINYTISSYRLGPRHTQRQCAAHEGAPVVAA